MTTASGRLPIGLEALRGGARAARGSALAVVVAAALAACAPIDGEAVDARIPTPLTVAEVQAAGDGALAHVREVAAAAAGGLSPAELTRGRPATLRAFCEEAVRPLGIVPSREAAPAQAEGVVEVLREGGWGWSLEGEEQAAVVQLACAAHLGFDHEAASEGGAGTGTPWPTRSGPSVTARATRRCCASPC
jgi:hypothetical protein